MKHVSAVGPQREGVRSAVDTSPTVVATLPLLRLQGSIGNGAVCELLSRSQAKLVVGDTNDPAELAADRIADVVMRALSASPPIAKESAVPPLQRVTDGLGTGDAAVDATTERAIRSHGGAPLGEHVRSPLEAAFGASFDEVRVHTDPAADALSRSLAARAFTHGNDIFFRAGEFAPSNSGGRRLLAHELAHTLQQRAGAAVVRRARLLSLRGVDKTYEGEDKGTPKQVEGNVSKIVHSILMTKALHDAAAKAGNDPSAKVVLPPQDIEGEKTFKNGYDATVETTLKYIADQRAKFQAQGLVVPTHMSAGFDVDASQRQAITALVPAVKYQTKDEQKQTRVTLGGQLTWSGEHPNQDKRNMLVDTSADSTWFSGVGTAIYAMSPRGDFHIASHQIGRFHHSSLLGGDPVAAAGEIKVDKGVVKMASIKTGHYKAGEDNLRQLIRVFFKRGVSLNFEVRDHENKPFPKKVKKPATGTATKTAAEWYSRDTYDREKTNTALASVLDEMKTKGTLGLGEDAEDKLAKRLVGECHFIVRPATVDDPMIVKHKVVRTDPNDPDKTIETEELVPDKDLRQALKKLGYGPRPRVTTPGDGDTWKDRPV
jgi:hypothetical protein